MLLWDEHALRVSQIAHATSFSWSGTMHHLAVLEQFGFVTSMRIGSRRVFFRPDASVHAEALALLTTPACRAVANAIIETPGLSIRELAARTRLSRRATYYHALRLRNAGVVVASGEPMRLDPAHVLYELVGR